MNRKIAKELYNAGLLTKDEYRKYTSEAYNTDAYEQKQYESFHESHRHHDIDMDGNADNGFSFQVSEKRKSHNIDSLEETCNFNRKGVSVKNERNNQIEFSFGPGKNLVVKSDDLSKIKNKGLDLAANVLKTMVKSGNLTEEEKQKIENLFKK